MSAILYHTWKCCKFLSCFSSCGAFFSCQTMGKKLSQTTSLWPWWLYSICTSAIRMFAVAMSQHSLYSIIRHSLDTICLSISCQFQCATSTSKHLEHTIAIWSMFQIHSLSLCFASLRFAELHFVSTSLHIFKFWLVRVILTMNTSPPLYHLNATYSGTRLFEGLYLNSKCLMPYWVNTLSTRRLVLRSRLVTVEWIATGGRVLKGKCDRN